MVVASKLIIGKFILETFCGNLTLCGSSACTWFSVEINVSEFKNRLSNLPSFASCKMSSNSDYFVKIWEEHIDTRFDISSKLCNTFSNFVRFTSLTEFSLISSVIELQLLFILRVVSLRASKTFDIIVR